MDNYTNDVIENIAIAVGIILTLLILVVLFKCNCNTLESENNRLENELLELKNNESLKNNDGDVITSDNIDCYYTIIDGMKTGVCEIEDFDF